MMSYMIPRETRSSHGSAVKTMKEVSLVSIMKIIQWEIPNTTKSAIEPDREAATVLVERGGKRNWACGFIDSRSSVHG